MDKYGVPLCDSRERTTQAGSASTTRPIRGKQQTKPRIDPITLAVVKGAVVSLCYEMGVIVERTSYSPVFTEGQDYSCAFFDGMGEEVAMHAFDANHLACMRYAVEWSLNEVGIGNVHPGDVIFCNDPYRGGNHVNDCTVYRPVFYRGKLVGIPAIRPHLIDLGGSAPGNVVGDATEIFQEGLRIPPVKLYSEGRLSEDILKMILANVRDPRSMRGDIEAVVGGLVMAERRILHYAEKYGPETWSSCLTEIKDASERFMRSAIDEIPEGRYEAEDYVDDDGISARPLRIKVAITVKGDRLIADFEGSSKEADGPINCTYAVTAGHTAIGVFHSIGITGDVAINEGSFRPIKALVPPGSVVNCNYPKPCVAGNTDTGPRVADLVVAALGQAVSPERTKGGCAGTQYIITIGGARPDTGALWVQYQYDGGGQGARSSKDGNNGIYHWATNNKMQPVEIVENTFPLLYEDFSLLADSPGPGKFRGGVGCRYVWKFLGPEGTLSVEGDRTKFFPFGVYGGLPPEALGCGHASCMRIRLKGGEFRHATELFGTESPSKWAKKKIHRGDSVENIITGGGGYGNPLERDPKAVMEDVIEGYISIANARRCYGVVIDGGGDDLSHGSTRVNREETEKLRGKR